MESSTGNKRSLIMQYFNMDIFIELMKITMIADINNNEKGTLVKDLLTKKEVPYTSLGSGTNRMAVLIDGYAVKIALDKDGMIDNRREMLYTRDLQPYVVKVYECVPNGLIAVTEYVTIFTLDDFHVYQQDMRNILEDISSEFLIGDVGITGKNYVNWGIRNDGSICILDYAYIYSVQYKLFVCSCDGSSLLRYDKDYVNMYCPHCGRKYTFGEIRKKVSKESQEKEIGDIRRLGYNISNAIETVTLNPEFEPKSKRDKKKKELTEEQKIIKEYKKRKKQEKEERLYGMTELEKEKESLVDYE